VVALDFILLFTRMTKQSSLTEIELDDQIIDFMQNVERIARNFCQYYVIDAEMLKYNPSAMGAAFFFIGF
jgi:hypothetical protein